MHHEKLTIESWRTRILSYVYERDIINLIFGDAHITCLGSVW